MAKKYWSNSISLGDVITIMVIALMPLMFFGCSDTKEEIEKKRSANDYKSLVDTYGIEEVVAHTIEPVVPETKDVPVGLNAWTTYWYVAFDVHIAKTDARYTGYNIVTLETQYFDVEQAIKQIEPNHVKEDYVGITFFKEVSVETYKAYEKSKL